MSMTQCVASTSLKEVSTNRPDIRSPNILVCCCAGDGVDDVDVVDDEGGDCR